MSAAPAPAGLPPNGRAQSMGDMNSAKPPSADHASTDEARKAQLARWVELRDQLAALAANLEYLKLMMRLQQK